ncbi:alpha/beta hydrolase-fold protein [Motilimonas sp. 1_MG-2023]|uniref:alpha/beta hydrolase-fold protein n=1 Tax=Motilimonas sp. 1_MG-2023 TaxID=3062672 RepID=UPI0026E1F6A7|nr:alpha/beta hydrolase-fold protein [Motilimonas sp. 1_MG-2023]MDO6527843.1 alpha/beta hydrolase-fold protein [Motilimonas sp. 1_MG-2023]
MGKMTSTKITYWLVAVCCYLPIFALAENGQLKTIPIQAQMLSGNRLGTDVKQEVMVYLPPSYRAKHTKIYPVMYWLLDFNQSIYELRKIQPVLDKWFSQSNHSEFVLVAVSGTNDFGGSFYLNSSLTGDWQDYLLFDLQAQVQRQIRVSHSPNEAAWLGFGMGGLAVLNLGLQFPSNVQHFAAFSPMVLQNKQLKQSISRIPRPILNAYSAAVSPVEGELYGQIPQFTDTEEDVSMQQAWYTGMGDWNNKLAIYFREYPQSDIFLACGGSVAADFSQGCEGLHQLFNEHYLSHDFENATASWQTQMEQVALPWLQRNLGR